jgi:hypothetical protein
MVTLTNDGEFARLIRLVESDAAQRWPMMKQERTETKAIWMMDGVEVVMEHKPEAIMVWVGELCRISPRKAENLDAFARRVVKRIHKRRGE